MNFKTKIFRVPPVNQVFWEIDSKGKMNENNKAMSWSLGKAMSWYKGGTEGFKNRSKHPSSFHFVGSEEKWSVQREIRLFRSWNTLPRAQNLKPKFEFQTSLARNYPAGTLELLSFGSNSDFPWDWRSSEILLRDSSLISPVGVYYASLFVGNYIFPRWGFTMLLLSWETTYIMMITIIMKKDIRKEKE